LVVPNDPLVNVNAEPVVAIAIFFCKSTDGVVPEELLIV
jgi:hypothetical protein